MATVALQQTRSWSGSFYVWMAGVFVVIAFGGFAETYWLQLPAGTFVGSPLLHLHGALFSAWTLFFFLQTYFVANGRLRQHRAWGLAGIALATALVIVGVTTAIVALNERLAAGYGDRARANLLLSISAMTIFAGFLAAGIATVSRPELHKRWMLLATMSLMPAAIARIFYVLATGGGPGHRPGFHAPPGPPSALPANLVVQALVLAAIVYDWRTRGRPHPIYLFGGALLLATSLSRNALAATPQWQAFADFLAGFAG